MSIYSAWDDGSDAAVYGEDQRLVSQIDGGFHKVLRSDPTVHKVMMGLSHLPLNLTTRLKQCVWILVEDKQKLMKRIEDKQKLMKRICELEAIAPRRYQLPDGKQVVWHRPDADIPLQNIQKP